MQQSQNNNTNISPTTSWLKTVYNVEAAVLSVPYIIWPRDIQSKWRVLKSLGIVPFCVLYLSGIQLSSFHSFCFSFRYCFFIIQFYNYTKVLQDYKVCSPKQGVIFYKSLFRLYISSILFPFPFREETTF